MSELQIRAAICEVGRRLWQHGLVGAAEGNITVRLTSRTLLTTPSGVSKGHLRPDDIVPVNLQGVPQTDQVPSSELKLHLRAFAKRPDCNAVVHAHPPVATGFALAGEEIPDNFLPEAAVVLGSVAVVPFAMPGTDELPDRIEPLLADHKTFLLSHHGAVVLGSDVYDAYNRMATLERVAKVIWFAKSLGSGPRAMPDQAFDHLLNVALNGRLD